MIPIIGADYPKVLIPLLDGSRKNIDIVVYDWRWYSDQLMHPVQQFNMALVRAVHRGVVVRALLNKPDILPTLQKVGIRAKQIRDRRTLHSKLVLIDGNTLVIGSHNFTRNAFAGNIETSIALSVPLENSRFADFFNNLYNI